jgi:hypothetical protein
MTDPVSTLIAKLEDERYAAMLSGDLATLDRLLDDRLRYVHSSGHADDKASYLAGLRKGKTKYLSISRENQSIVILGESAAVFVTFHLEVAVPGAVRSVHARALALWSLSQGAWRVGAVLSGSIPAP